MKEKLQIRQSRKAYQEFIEWLGRSWWKLPPSNHLMPMISSYISEEEARLLTGFPLSSKGLEDIAAAKGMEPRQLKARLESLIQRGLVYESRRGDSVRYRLNDSFFIFLRAIYWSGRPDEKAEAATPHVNRYYMDGWFDQYADVHLKGLRTIPIEKTVEDPRKILPFEDIVKVVEKFEYFSVSHCPCRMRHNLDPETADCPHSTEVCLHFDELGRYIVENGMGREITKEQTLEILRKAADEGLVHAISNWEEKPDTICNCCSDACIWFEAYHRLGHPGSVDPSNYVVKVRPSQCKACGLCIKRCPMDALQFKSIPEATNRFRKAPVVDPSRCIGCGVCVHKCPTESLVLIKKEHLTRPPRDVRQYMERYMADRSEAQGGDRGPVSL